jgi:hypothetical protein
MVSLVRIEDPPRSGLRIDVPPSPSCLFLRQIIHAVFVIHLASFVSLWLLQQRALLNPEPHTRQMRAGNVLRADRWHNRRPAIRKRRPAGSEAYRLLIWRDNRSGSKLWLSAPKLTVD